MASITRETVLSERISRVTDADCKNGLEARCLQPVQSQNYFT